MVDFIQQTIDSYMTAQHQTVMVSVIIAVVSGLLICFFGYKLLRLWCAIIGFVAGALVSGLVAYAMGADVVLLVACIVGIVTAILSFAFYRAGVFVIGFGAALNVIGHFISAYAVNTQWWMIVLTIAAAVIIGSLAVRFVKTVVVISTSLSGAVSVVTNILGIFNVTNWKVISILTAILAVLGMAYQFTHSRRKRRGAAEESIQPASEDTDEILPSDETTPEETTDVTDEDINIRETPVPAIDAPQEEDTSDTAPMEPYENKEETLN